MKFLKPIRSRPAVCLFCRLESQARASSLLSIPNQSFVRPKSNRSSTHVNRKTDRSVSFGKGRAPYKDDSIKFQPGAPRPDVAPLEKRKRWSPTLLKERLGTFGRWSTGPVRAKIDGLIWTSEAKQLYRSNPTEWSRRRDAYVKELKLALDIEDSEPTIDRVAMIDAQKTIEELKLSYNRGGLAALDVALMDSFLLKKYETAQSVYAQREMTDFSFPIEWFPKTRQLKRTWHLHVGPTNSGKTYNALKKLEESRDGIYCGPLRLLAHEVYERLNAKGVLCNLITGEERRLHENVECRLTSSTVEMAAVEEPFEVAVIDEIQMISDPDRGWAWTHAVLGIMAKELHLCGEDRAVGIIQKLAEMCGEKVIIHRYQRLGQLVVQDQSLQGDFKKIEKGDCVVAFSRKDIHTLKRYIEPATGLRCAIVYGALPAETRALQAKYFNDPDSGYDVLVASDAIGLGLNLSIKRIIFSSMYKFNGTSTIIIPVPLTRQISGRAGRYRSSADDRKTLHSTFPPSGSPENITTLGPPADSKTGFVTTLLDRDLELLQANMIVDVPPIEKAILLPRNSVIENYAALFSPDTKFHEILQRISNQARVSDLFIISDMSNQIETAKLLDGIPGLSDNEKADLSLAPVKHRVEACCEAFKDFARAIGSGRLVTILDIPSIDLEALDERVPDNPDALSRLEQLHQVIMIYSWLSIRFRYNLTGHEITQKVKDLCEKMIDEGFKKIEFIKSQAVLRPTKSKRPAGSDWRDQKREQARQADDALPPSRQNGLGYRDKQSRREGQQTEGFSPYFSLNRNGNSGAYKDKTPYRSLDRVQERNWKSGRIKDQVIEL